MAVPVAVTLTTLGLGPRHLVRGERAEFPLPCQEEAPVWIIREYRTVSNVLRSLPRGSVIVVGPLVPEYINEDYKLQSPDQARTVSGYVGLMPDNMTWDNVAIPRLLFMIGIPQFCVNMLSMARGIATNVRYSIHEAGLAGAVVQGPIIEMNAAVTEVVHAYIATEEGLRELLHARAISRDDKIASTMASLFPWIRGRTPPGIILTPWTRETAEVVAGNVPAELTDTTTASILQLIRMGLWLLGPAYSQSNTFRDQTLRRIQAVAAMINQRRPTPEEMQSVVQNTWYDVGDNSSLVDAMLGIVLCMTRDNRVNPDAAAADLRPVDELAQQYQLPLTTTCLLSQMKLVYTNYHSTSLHFVPNVIAPMLTLISPNDPVLGGDLAHFRTIEATVNTAPYMGLRQTIPEAHQNRMLPRLVVLALWFHGRCLPPGHDQDEFKKYNIEGIVKHITNQEQVNYVRTLANQLPTISSLAIANLLRTLPRDKAQLLLSSKTAQEQQELIGLLRESGNPGAYVQELIDQENGQFQLMLVEQAGTALNQELNDQYAWRQAIANRIENNADRIVALNNLDAWRQTIRSRINNLVPRAQRLTIGTTPDQRRIRQEDGAQKI